MTKHYDNQFVKPWFSIILFVILIIIQRCGFPTREDEWQITTNIDNHFTHFHFIKHPFMYNGKSVRHYIHSIFMAERRRGKEVIKIIPPRNSSWIMTGKEQNDFPFLLEGSHRW